MIQRTPILDGRPRPPRNIKCGIGRRGWRSATARTCEGGAAIASDRSPVHRHLPRNRRRRRRPREQARPMLGWRVLGRELLDRIALRYGLSRSILDSIDKTTPNWVAEIFGRWFDRQLVTPSQYLRHLGHVVLTAAQAESGIFVGRRRVLPAFHRGISVAWSHRWTCGLPELWKCRLGPSASGSVHPPTDGTRKDFVAGHFRRSIDDAHLYDLTLNRKYIDIDAAAALIAEAVRRRFCTNAI